MPRLLIVSPHFPPVNAPDMQRIRVSLPYFVTDGWDVTILTVDDPTPLAPVEPELNATVPGEVRVERAFCLSRRWTSWLGLNNVALRALPFLFFAGCRLLNAQRYDAVYFSTTMFIVLPFGRLWKNVFRVPYVVDLQDPWVSDFYERPGSPPPPGGWKYRFAHGTGRVLEGWTLRGAAQLISVSEAYLIDLRTRHPALANTPGTELPFGSPDPDLQQVRATLKRRQPILPAGGSRLVFAGAIGPGMLSSVELLFAALAEVKRQGVTVSAHFFGTSYSPKGQGKPATLELAASYGVQDRVHEQTDRLAYFDALQVTLEAEGNLLFGSTDLAFVPSKILTVLAAERPVIAIAPVKSALGQRLALLGQPYISFSPVERDSTSISQVAAQLLALANHTAARPNQELLHSFGAGTLARRQETIFSAASESQLPPSSPVI